MRNVLYVANIAPDFTADALQELFAEHGQVASVEMGQEEHTRAHYALVTMDREKDATRANNALNGHELEGMRLAVSYPEPDLNRPLTSKQRKVVDQIRQALNEQNVVPTRQIEALTLLCGTAFVEALLAETEAVEAAAGIMTSDGKRRRSKGGVFFYLARYRIAQSIRGIVYNRKGRLPEPEAADEAAAGAD